MIVDIATQVRPSAEPIPFQNGKFVSSKLSFVRKMLIPLPSTKSYGCNFLLEVANMILDRKSHVWPADLISAASDVVVFENLFFLKTLQMILMLV